MAHTSFAGECPCWSAFFGRYEGFSTRCAWRQTPHVRCGMPPRTSENSPSETVWKIAENVSARLSGGKKRPNWDSFHPSWPLSEPPFETYPEFPNSLSTMLGE